jgi:glycosyltransferase involved in cell wall biosynthesis
VRVIVLNDQAHVSGGAAAVALGSARGLAARGVPTTLFAAVAPIAPDLEDTPGLRVVCLGQQEIARDSHRLRAFASGLWNAAAHRALAAELAAFDPAETVLHVHSWTKALSPSVLHLAISRGFKVVLTLHDFFIGCPTGGLFVHRTAEICTRTPLSWSCISCSCDRRNYGHKLWRTARTVWQNRLLRIPEGIAHFAGVSELSVNIMRPWLPPGSPVTIVRNPVDAVDLGPAPVAESAPFLFIGRFSVEKGVLLAAEAVRRAGVPAVFIGDGELAAEARALCPQATFTGWLGAAEIREWLQRGRALLFPPLWYETLGLVVVEAAAAGLPAIVSDRCAARDFVADGERGLHFTHGSVEALVAAIERLQDPTLAARLGRQAYDWYWNDPWTVDRHVDSLLALYKEVLAANDAPAFSP